MEKVLSLIGRVFFSLPFLVFGFNHLTGAKPFEATVPTWLPFGIFWVYFSGVVLVVAALAIIFRKHERLSCLILALLLVAHILNVHFNALVDPQRNLMEMASVFKDTGLLGAALFMAGTFKK